jgi:hypothetical protein
MSVRIVDLFVRKEYFKFNAAHFVVLADSREALHGHNYTVAVGADWVPVFALFGPVR